MKKIKILKKVLASEIGNSLAWEQKELYALGDENKDFDFNAYIIDSNGEIIEKVVINVPANTMAEWENDSEITAFILANLNLENLGNSGNRVKINKEYSPKVAQKFTWSQTKNYSLENKNLKNDTFDAFVYTADDNLIFKKEIIVPPTILELWGDDEIITNYLLSKLGLKLDLDNTIGLVLAKLNSGTITYASGTQEENDNVLKNYATFVALQIESYKEGSLEIEEFIDISNYDVTVTSDSVAMTMKEFVLSLKGLSDAEKTSKLNSCVASIEAWLEDEEEVAEAE
jgi:hypothetical protein